MVSFRFGLFVLWSGKKVWLGLGRGFGLLNAFLFYFMRFKSNVLVMTVLIIEECWVVSMVDEGFTARLEPIRCGFVHSSEEC